MRRYTREQLDFLNQFFPTCVLDKDEIGPSDVLAWALKEGLVREALTQSNSWYLKNQGSEDLYTLRLIEEQLTKALNGE